mmetsp:Transcript_8821/g.15271  ORF Transcript_8821/g.15271 Transcript_8821/m.15271 type:complete len:83 (-) Transcript_8821:300-548(-)
MPGLVGGDGAPGRVMPGGGIGALTGGVEGPGRPGWPASGADEPGGRFSDTGPAADGLAADVLAPFDTLPGRAISGGTGWAPF